jgi:hypothetical protein
MAEETLDRLYKLQPSSQADIKKSARYSGRSRGCARRLGRPDHQRKARPSVNPAGHQMFKDSDLNQNWRLPMGTGAIQLRMPSSWRERSLGHLMMIRARASPC